MEIETTCYLTGSVDVTIKGSDKDRLTENRCAGSILIKGR